MGSDVEESLRRVAQPWEHELDAQILAEARSLFGIGVDGLPYLPKLPAAQQPAPQSGADDTSFLGGPLQVDSLGEGHSEFKGPVCPATNST